jgi:hypothetical protein
VNTRKLLVALILVATAAFAVGVAIERSEGGEEGAETEQEQAGEPAVSDEAAESAETAEQSEAQGEEADGSGDEGGEEILGIDPESIPVVLVGVAVSLALAAAVWLRSARGVAAVVVLAMLAFAALDVRELAHQIDEENAGLAVTAGLVACLHLAAATLAVIVAWEPTEARA